MEEKTLTTGRIFPTLIKFLLPILFALFLQNMYGTIDMIIIGRYATVGDLSGVSIGSMFLMLPTFVIAAFCTGVTVAIGEHIGAGRREEAGKVIGTGVIFFAIISVLAAILIFIFAPAIATAMSAPQESFAPTVNYLKICGAGMIFIVAYNVLGAVFRGVGDSKTPLITVAIAAVINLFIDICLVKYAGLGAGGAALATVIAQGLSVIISIFIIKKRGLPFPFKLSFIKIDKEHLKKILKIGIPLALQDLLVNISFLYVQKVANEIDVNASAAIGVGERICVFLMIITIAFIQSLSAFVAQNNGAGLFDRSKAALKVALITAVITGICSGSIAFFGGGVLASIFNDDPAVIAATHLYLKAYAIDNFLAPIFFSFLGYFNGCEKSFFVMVQGIVGAFFIRIPVVYFMSHLPNATLFHIGLGTPASSVVQLIMCIIAYFYFDKQFKKEGRFV